MKNRWFRLVCISSLMMTLVVSSWSCKHDNKNTSVKPVTVSFKKEGSLKLVKAVSDSVVAQLDIEIADDEYTTQTGLMYRKSMAPNQGMLFIFPNEDYRSFYMKNTEIPLDIIYIAEDKTIVSIQKDAKPMDETSLPSEAPAKYVLEVNAGLSTTWRLEKGDKIVFSRF